MYSNLEYKLFYHRNLPHIQPENGFFFITYRLAFSLPKNKLWEIQQKHRNLFENKVLNNYQRDSRLFKYYDDILAKELPQPKWLDIKEIADLVKENLHYHHQKRYELICYTIMPNHVHLVIYPLKNKNNNFFSLAAILKWHKNYTALKANKVLKRSGRFWHHENYDHFIRNEKELNKIINYIVYNPVKGKLVNKITDWPYTWLNPKYGKISEL